MVKLVSLNNHFISEVKITNVSAKLKPHPNLNQLHHLHIQQVAWVLDALDFMMTAALTVIYVVVLQQTVLLLIAREEIQELQHTTLSFVIMHMIQSQSSLLTIYSLLA